MLKKDYKNNMEDFEKTNHTEIKNGFGKNALIFLAGMAVMHFLTEFYNKHTLQTIENSEITNVPGIDAIIDELNKVAILVSAHHHGKIGHKTTQTTKIFNIDMNDYTILNTVTGDHFGGLNLENMEIIHMPDKKQVIIELNEDAWFEKAFYDVELAEVSNKFGPFSEFESNITAKESNRLNAKAEKDYITRFNRKKRTDFVKRSEESIKILKGLLKAVVPSDYKIKIKFNKSKKTLKK